MTPHPPGFSLLSLAATSLPSRIRFPLSLCFDDPQWFVLSPLNLLFLFVLPRQPHLLTGFQSIRISRVQKSHPHLPPGPKCPMSNSNSTLPNVKSLSYHFPPLSNLQHGPYTQAVNGTTMYPGSQAKKWAVLVLMQLTISSQLRLLPLIYLSSNHIILNRKYISCITSLAKKLFKDFPWHHDRVQGPIFHI